MTKAEWKQIYLAKELLGLGDKATLAAIKQAFRRMCKIHHPDMKGVEQPDDAEIIRKLTDAYEILLKYCNQYQFPLIADEGVEVEPDDWWMDRFGQDPLWGKKK